MASLHCPQCGCFYTDQTTCPDCECPLQSVRKMVFGFIFGLVLVAVVLALLILPQILNGSHR